jgi:hypothetical protein
MAKYISESVSRRLVSSTCKSEFICPVEYAARRLFSLLVTTQHRAQVLKR